MATRESTTSTIPTLTSTPATTTPCSIHTRPTARHWIPGSALCCCRVSGPRIRHLPTQAAPHTAWGWRQRWTPAATAPSQPPLSPGPPLRSMDRWTRTTRVLMLHNHHICSTLYYLIWTKYVFLSFCSCWSSNQNKDISLVLTDSLKLNREYLSHQKKTQRGFKRVAIVHGCSFCTLLAYWYELWTSIPAFTWLQVDVPGKHLQTTSVTGGLCPLSIFMQCETKLFCFKSFILIHTLFCNYVFFVLFCFLAFLMAVNAFLKFYVYSFYQKRFLFFIFSCWIPLAKMLNCLPEDSFTCLWWLCRVNNSCVCLNNKLLNCIFQTILLNVFLSDTVPYGT